MLLKYLFTSIILSSIPVSAAYYHTNGTPRGGGEIKILTQGSAGYMTVTNYADTFMDLGDTEYATGYGTTEITIKKPAKLRFLYMLGNVYIAYLAGVKVYKNNEKSIFSRPQCRLLFATLDTFCH